MEWLTRLSAHLPYALLACALLLLVILVLLGLWLRRHLVREEAAAKAEAEEPGGLVASASAPPAAGLAAALPFELARSFARAVRYLRGQTSGRQRLYQLPWYLALGEAGAGKTTLLRAIGGLDPRGAAEPEPRAGMGWHFFDHGVVLDVPGDYLLRPETLAAHERSWRGLLRLLNRYRPRRPLDGVVLVLPAHDFATASALDQATLLRKATRIGEKLGQLQRDSGVCFPVYVVVSKCDYITGFQSFCRALPAARLREIFGWSSPYRMEAGFESAWVDEAFEQVVEALNRCQSELFVERLDALDPATLYFFPGEMLQMRDRLRGFLHQVFRHTSYRESFNCRGLYFCGDSGPEAGGAAPPRDGVEGLELARGGGLLGLQFADGGAAPRTAFVEDLFERKIFPEWGLATLGTRALGLRRGARLAAQNLALATALALAAGLGWGGYRLHRLERQALPVLQDIQADMTDAQARAAGNAELQRHADDFVRSVARLGNERFYSFFVPASWFSSLDSRIQGAIEIAFEKSVLAVALQGLTQRAQAIGLAPPPPAVVATLPPPAAPVANAAGLSPGQAADAAYAADAAAGAAAATGAAAPPPAPLPGDVALVQLPEYAALAQFTAQVAALEDNIARYQRIVQPGHPGEVADLNQLMHYLDPAATADYTAAGEASYLVTALDSASSGPFPAEQLAAARQRVHAQMTSRVDALFDAWYQDSPALAAMQNLSGQIDRLGASASFGDRELASLQAALDQAEALVHGPQAAWMATPEAIFDGPLRSVTLDPVEHSAHQDDGLFYPAADLEAYIRSTATADWDDLHDQLAGETTALTGPLLQFSPGGVRLSPGAENLRLPIVDLTSLPFMAGAPNGTLRPAVPAGNHLVWDPAPLQEAVSMVGAYNRYLNEGLMEAPASVRDAFRKIALAHLTANLVDQIGQAEIWVPDTPGTGASADVAAEIKSMQAAQPLLTELLGDLAALGQNATRAQLLETAHQHADRLLGELDAQLQAEAPYGTRSNLQAWDGARPPALAAFGLPAPEDLAGYLDFERQQMQTLAAAAGPLVTFLERAPTAARSASDIELTARWQRLAAAVQQYNNKVPGNSLSELENYILADMDKVTPADHCGPAPAPAASARADFFLDARARLRRTVYARCSDLDREAAARSYSALASLFNRTLAGKFPFASPGPAGSVEADPDAIAAFYKRLDQDQASLAAPLPAPAAEAFLESMRALRPLWDSFIANQARQPVPVFDLTPSFRVNQAHERGGNEIIAWTLQVGSQAFHSGQPAQSVRWSLGVPISLSLQWAKDAPRRPVPGAAAQPAVRGDTATFTFDDPWSLFTLLELHQAPAADFDYLVDQTPNTLVFNILTAPAANLPGAAPRPPGAAAGAAPAPAATALASVFVRIAFMAPGKVESLRVPQFPQQAPIWDLATHASSASH